MEFIKAKEILNTIEKLDQNSTETVLKALKVAEFIEESSEDFYKKEVEKRKGTELEEFYLFLVKEEEMHLRKIKELGAELKNNELKNIQFEKNELPKILPKSVDQGELTAILYGLWKEKKAVEFYTQASEKTSGAVKNFFKELAEFEKEHVNLFEELVEGTLNVNELIMG